MLSLAVTTTSFPEGSCRLCLEVSPSSHQLCRPGGRLARGRHPSSLLSSCLVANHAQPNSRLLRLLTKDKYCSSPPGGGERMAGIHEVLNGIHTDNKDPFQGYTGHSKLATIDICSYQDASSP